LKSSIVRLEALSRRQRLAVVLPGFTERQLAGRRRIVGIDPLLDQPDDLQRLLSGDAKRHGADPADRVANAAHQTSSTARALPEIALHRPGGRLLVDDDDEALELGVAHDIAAIGRRRQIAHIGLGQFSRLEVA